MARVDDQEFGRTLFYKSLQPPGKLAKSFPTSVRHLVELKVQNAIWQFFEPVIGRDGGQIQGRIRRSGNLGGDKFRYPSDLRHWSRLYFLCDRATVSAFKLQPDAARANLTPDRLQEATEPQYERPHPFDAHRIVFGRHFACARNRVVRRDITEFDDAATNPSILAGIRVDHIQPVRKKVKTKWQAC